MVIPHGNIQKNDLGPSTNSETRTVGHKTARAVKPEYSTQALQDQDAEGLELLLGRIKDGSLEGRHREHRRYGMAATPPAGLMGRVNEGWRRWSKSHSWLQAITGT